MYFEAILVPTCEQPLIRALEQLDDPDDPAFVIAPITLTVQRVNPQGYAVFGWRSGARRPDCAEEVEDLAGELSSLLKVSTVAVHYDDQVGKKIALIVRNGEPIRYYGPLDEVWVPYGEDVQPVLDGPQYSGETIPHDIECDCIRNSIDAALEAAGFSDWITMEKLQDVAYDWSGENFSLVWKRSGK
jgi:hypothetical protein